MHTRNLRMQCASVIPDGNSVFSPPEANLQIVVLGKDLVAILHDEAVNYRDVSRRRSKERLSA